MKLALSLGSPLYIFEVSRSNDLINHVFLLRSNLTTSRPGTENPSMSRPWLLGIWDAKCRHHISLAVKTSEMFHQLFTVFLHLFFSYRLLLAGEESLLLCPLPLHLIIDFLYLSQGTQKVGPITTSLGVLSLHHPPIYDLEQPLGFS